MLCSCSHILMTVLYIELFHMHVHSIAHALPTMSHIPLVTIISVLQQACTSVKCLSMVMVFSMHDVVRVGITRAVGVILIGYTIT